MYFNETLYFNFSIMWKKRRINNLEYRILVSFLVLMVITSLVMYLEEIQWYFVYYYAFEFDSLNYLYNTRVNCGSRGRDIIKREPVANQSWDSLIALHLNSAHSGWIIAKHPVSFGLCNRILDITSLLMLAIATNRTLWIEWDEQGPVQLNPVEPAAMTAFDDMFNSSFRDSKFRPSSSVMEKAPVMDRACFLHHVATSSDLNADLGLSDNDAIVFAGWDWWGGLLLRNPYYGPGLFNGLNFSVGFPALFRHVFQLRPPIIQPGDCSWVIQYRFKLPEPRWRRLSIDRFLECAIARGMMPSDYSTTWIITDSKRKMLEQASPDSRKILSLMHLPEEEEGCRGPCGDRKAVETIYRLSQCKHAVLSFGSSFGSCTTSFAGIQNIHRVGRFGDCHALPVDEPFDMNTVSRHGNTATFLSRYYGS